MSENANQPHYLRENGVVIKIEDGFAYVQTTRTTGCSGCSSESGCGTSALAKLFTRESKEPLKVRKTIDCEVGDKVELLLDESRLLKHSFMAYGLPLIGLFLVAIIASEAAQVLYQTTESTTELVAILGAVVGMYGGWKLTQKFYQPVLPELGSVLKN